MKASRLPAWGVTLALAGTMVACTTSSSPVADPVAPDPVRSNTVATVYAARSFKAAILTCSPDEVTVANYLKAQSAIRYPLVQITIIPVIIPPDLTSASGAVEFTTLFAAVTAAIGPKEAAQGGRFDMIQLLHQFPHHVSWGAAKPGASCGVSTDNRWSVESILAAGFDAKAASDSPPSFSIGTNIIPWKGAVDISANWRLMYLVTRLEGHTIAEVNAKIDRACAPASATRPGVIIDGPGKNGTSNNGAGYTYWENTWFADGVNKVTSQGNTFGYSTKNDMIGYTGDSNANNSDDASEMPAAAWTYQTSSTFPVGYLLSFGLHSNGNGSMGPGFTSPSQYANLPFSSRSVILGGESFSAYALDGSHPGYGGTTLGQWLALNSAGFIGPKNEPCATGIDTGLFTKLYCGQNLTFAEAAHASFHTTKGIYSPFGVAWMTLR
ncbi:MAG: hypothetical protein ABI743_10720 [bacterium]